MKKLLFIKLLHRYNKIIVKERMTVMDSRILIAPCGMNCMLCQAYQGKGLSCQGCGQKTQRKSCQNCLIYRCPEKSDSVLNVKNIHADDLKIWIRDIARNIK